jgi:putative ABC transport system permease protein
MGSFMQDIRYAVRGFLRAPGFALVAIVTLALGIGATTSIFSVVNGIVLRPLPYPNAERLVRLYSTEGAEDRDNHAGANFIDVKTQNESFEQLAGFSTGRYSLVGTDVPVVVRGASVTADYFSVLGVNALIGRTLSPEVDLPGGDRAVVLSYSLWQSQFAGDVAILGSSMTVEGTQYTVVGVMPSGFSYPGPTLIWMESDYRVPDPPFDFGGDPADNRGAQYFNALGRLRDGVSLVEAQAEMTGLADRLKEAYPDVNANEGLNVVPLHESIVGNTRSTLYVLFGAVGFLLLIACANVANLLLVRASGRDKEMVVRAAMGAGRARILRQLVTESALLALAGGAVGLLISVWGTKGLLALAPAGIPRLAEVGTDLRVLGFTLSAALGTGVLFGLAPAIQSFKSDLRAAAAVGGGRQTAGQIRSRLRNGFIVAEVAVSLLLLVGAGLTIRTFITLTNVDPGFDPGNTLTARVDIPESRYQTNQEQVEFYRTTLERVRSIPGVLSAGGVLSLPISMGMRGDLVFAIEGRPLVPGEESHGGYQLASPDYFGTLGIPLLRGRVFTEADNEDESGVAVINQALADLYWAEEDPIGKRVTWNTPPDDNSNWSTIVGVVGNTVYWGLDQPPRPEIYSPYMQAPMPYMTVVVRSERDVAGLTAAVRNTVLEVDPTQPIYQALTMERVLFASLGSQRFSMCILGAFAAAAILLAGVGIYGVLSFGVTQRSSEIGIRMALGAQTGNVIGGVIKEGCWLTIIGLGIGTAAAVGLTRVMESMIHGVSATDPLTFAGGIILLTAIALIASWIPARRASRVSPMEVLRVE